MAKPRTKRQADTPGMSGGDSASGGRGPAGRDPAGYDVGYGKPPANTRFQRGRSGNPKGRPKGSKSFERLLQEELETKVTFLENGRHRKQEKRRLLVKRIVNDGLKGDTRATRLILDLTSGATAGEAGAAEPLDPVQRKLIEDYLQRIKGGAS